MPSRAEALRILGFDHPLDYEARTLSNLPPGDPPRITGWTTRLCVEAALDVRDAKIVMLVTRSSHELDQMLSRVREYVTKLKGSHAGRLLGAIEPAFTRIHGASEVVHDDGGNPVVVYQDNWRPDGSGGWKDVRLIGPFGEIREVRLNFGGRITAHDYDGNYLMDLEQDGLQELRKDHRFRISVIGPEEAKERPGASAFGPKSGTDIRSVRVRADGPISTKNRMAPAVVDGIRLEAGDYVLVVGQREPRSNGIYVVGRPGGDGRQSGGTWNRVSSPPTGTSVMVLEGSQYAGTVVVRTDGPQWHGMAASKKEDDIDALIAQIHSVDTTKIKELESMWDVAPDVKGMFEDKGKPLLEVLEDVLDEDSEDSDFLNIFGD